MIERMIRMAFDTGNDVAVYVQHLPHTRFHGRVQDVDGTFFSLFHAGDQDGWLWAFRLDEVVACALITPPPYLAGAEHAAIASPHSPA